ncbi:hypothetical protein BKA62DRAFT_747439 [Auriculariales sp. MPI-PUGE-AT-0066]|nr:hypothetical protein BKA62DRAFT_747439 [Auriculariales sp. MPI-PUGE-AT-0066]
MQTATYASYSQSRPQVTTFALNSSVARTALFYRAASLPPSPSMAARSNEPSPAAPRASFDEMTSLQHHRQQHPQLRSDSPLFDSNADYNPNAARTTTAQRSQPLSVPSSSRTTKAQRLLGLAQQLEKDARFSRNLDRPISTASGLRNEPSNDNNATDDDDDDDDNRSFVDFGSGSDEIQQQLTRPTSVVTFDSGFDFAPPSPNAITRFHRLTQPEPTAFIPTFSASSTSFGSQPKHRVPCHGPPAGPPPAMLPLPPTTNTLSNASRADLLRRHKKLQQVLGDGIASVHPFARDDAGAWPPNQRETVYLSAGSKRHSQSLSPTTPKRHSFDMASLSSVLTYQSDASFVDMDDDHDRATSAAVAREMPASPSVGDSHAPPTPRALRARQLDSLSSLADSLSSGSTGSQSRRSRHRGRSFSVDVVPSPPGSPHSWVFVGTGGVGKGSPLGVEGEEERRRKRAKLTKLHRFLGSRVPADMVLGISSPDDDLPPVAAAEPQVYDDDVRFKTWMRRKSNRSASPYPSGPVSPQAENEDSQLNASELCESERMINVKRAQKMEKLFGAQPPQTLFHTRPHGGIGTMRAADPAAVLARPYPSSAPSTPSLEPTALPAVSASGRMQKLWNASGNGKGALWRRPSDPDTDSSQHLLGITPVSSQSAQLMTDEDDGVVTPQATRPKMSSLEYQHYEQSLTSLGAMIDRGDRASLMELVDYVNEASSEDDAAHAAATSSSSLDRRRSLPPARASSSSAASVLTLDAENDEAPSNGFGLRRKRAQKLANFFGVQHRELFGEVIDSIEMSVRDEASRGSLRPDEAQELINRLRVLRTRGVDQFSH